MSQWTHITACLSVETFIEEPKKELLKQVKTYLKNAPKITGSERDANIFINVVSGHNSWTNFDCEHCEYKNTLRDVIIDGQEYQECDAPEGHDCSGEYQSHIVISIQGDLRDRAKEDTEKEFQNFIEYIQQNYDIRDYSVNIEGE